MNSSENDREFSKSKETEGLELVEQPGEGSEETTTATKETLTS